MFCDDFLCKRKVDILLVINICPFFGILSVLLRFTASDYPTPPPFWYLRFTVSDYPFCILDLRLLITPFVS